MKIYIKDNVICAEFPKWQATYDALGEEFGEVPNLIGVIEGDECNLHYAIEMGYKDGGIQVGDLAIGTHLEKKEFKKLCEELGLPIEEHPNCAKCQKPVWGSFTLDVIGEPVCCEK